MILTYSNHKFKDLILSGEKIHTIREDPADRWRVGMKIHHWTHSPRNPIRGPHQFAEGECMGIQQIHIISQGLYLPNVFVMVSGDKPGFWMDDFQVVLLATNDGLSPEEFREWFVPSDRPEFIGKIIHFTDFLYNKQ